MSMAYRRLMGLVLGCLFGFGYSLVAQMINQLAMPTIPLYQSPPGPVGNIALGALGGAVYGLICAWPESSILGMIWAGLAGSAAIFAIALSNMLASPALLGGYVLLALYTFLPIAGLLGLTAGLLRWAINQQAQPLFYRGMVSVGVLIVAGGLGMLNRYPPAAVQVLTHMHALLQTGQAAPTAAELPAPLKSNDVMDFKTYGQGAYVLLWDDTDLDRFPIRRPASNPLEQSVAIAYFENRWMLVCLFATPRAEPTCIGMGEQQDSSVQH